jgi:hypothetical protein
VKTKQDPSCYRQRGGRHCAKPLSQHDPITGQCPGFPEGALFREHSSTTKRAGNSFTMQQAKILDAVFSGMVHGKLTEQVIRGFVRQHRQDLLKLAVKGRKMVATIEANAEATREGERIAS